MSGAAITRLVRVGRWEPDARGRLARAALELFADGGFEQTTVADIAERAGVTERTFFRYFADKREVLFDGAATLQKTVLDAIAAAPPERAPIDVVAGAFVTAAPLLEARGEFAGQRANAIVSNPSLQERESLKMVTLAAAAADALRARGVADPAAGLAAEAGVTVFRIGFEKWVTGSAGGLAQCIEATLDALKVLTAGAPPPPASDT
jgi:AcrR family transcriptional regulator